MSKYKMNKSTLIIIAKFILDMQNKYSEAELIETFYDMLLNAINSNKENMYDDLEEEKYIEFND
jgi:hypothetical protein